jgi:hypothetical protein
MDPALFEKLFEEYFTALELEQASLYRILNRYALVLESLFSDNIYNRNRFYVADYFAVYIDNRVSRYPYLLQALREILDEKYPSIC